MVNILKSAKPKGLNIPLGLCLLCGLPTFNFCTTHEKVTKSQPNVILFLVDDMGWRDVGFMGSRYYDTPNIDKLASQGMIFTNAYANAPNCAPSRACLMSGLYPSRHGIYTVNESDRGDTKKRKLIPVVNKTVLDGSYITMAEMLKQAGYATCHAGKWHLGDGVTTSPKGQGFDVNYGGTHAGHPKSYFSPYHNPNLTDGPQGEYLTDRLTSDVLNFVDKNKDNPFFVYFSHYAVHTPLQGKPEYVDEFRNKAADGGQDNAKYAAMIKSTDESLGRLMDKLDELGIADNTLIVFFSDNGGAGEVTSCKPLRGAKGTMYEGGVREPMIIKWPGKVRAASRCDEPVMGIDFYPTFSELVGVTSQGESLDGESLVPLMRESGSLKREAIYWHFPAYLEANANTFKYPEDLTRGWRAVPSGAVRKGDWKLIEDFEEHTYKLYNLSLDLSESNNLAEQFPEITNELLEDMRAWRVRVNAPVPTQVNPNYHSSVGQTAR